MNNMNAQFEYMELASRRDRYKTSHILHLLLSFLSVGMWVPIWVLVALSNANERMKCEAKIRKLVQSAGKINVRY